MCGCDIYLPHLHCHRPLIRIPVEACSNATGANLTFCLQSSHTIMMVTGTVHNVTVKGGCLSLAVRTSSGEGLLLDHTGPYWPATAAAMQNVDVEDVYHVVQALNGGGVKVDVTKEDIAITMSQQEAAAAHLVTVMCHSSKDASSMMAIMVQDPRFFAVIGPPSPAGCLRVRTGIHCNVVVEVDVDAYLFVSTEGAHQRRRSVDGRLHTTATADDPVPPRIIYAIEEHQSVTISCRDGEVERFVAGRGVYTPDNLYTFARKIVDREDADIIITSCAIVSPTLYGTGPRIIRLQDWCGFLGILHTTPRFIATELGVPVELGDPDDVDIESVVVCAKKLECVSTILALEEVTGCATLRPSVAGVQMLAYHASRTGVVLRRVPSQATPPGGFQAPPPTGLRGGGDNDKTRIFFFDCKAFYPTIAAGGELSPETYIPGQSEILTDCWGAPTGIEPALVPTLLRTLARLRDNATSRGRVYLGTAYKLISNALIGNMAKMHGPLYETLVAFGRFLLQRMRDSIASMPALDSPITMTKLGAHTDGFQIEVEARVSLTEGVWTDVGNKIRAHALKVGRASCAEISCMAGVGPELVLRIDHICRAVIYRHNNHFSMYQRSPSSSDYTLVHKGRPRGEAPLCLALAQPVTLKAMDVITPKECEAALRDIRVRDFYTDYELVFTAKPGAPNMASVLVHMSHKSQGVNTADRVEYFLSNVRGRDQPVAERFADSYRSTAMSTADTLDWLECERPSKKRGMKQSTLQFTTRPRTS